MANVTRKDRADYSGWLLRWFSGSNGSSCTARRWSWQGGRIFAIADVFDVLTSPRPYKEALSFDASMEIIGRDRGTHFDPQLLDAFAKIARPLHEALTTRDEAYSHQELQLVVTRYFRQDIETLLARDMA